MNGFEGGNRRHWQGPGRGYDAEMSSGVRGPTALEIALVRKLGGKVRLYNADFANIRRYVVHRTEDPSDDSVILEVRDKSDARDRTIELVRQPDGRFAVDQYGGL